MPVLQYLNGTHPNQASYSPSIQDAVAYFRSVRETWTNPVYAGTTYGVGEDNPLDSYELTSQQVKRCR